MATIKVGQTTKGQKSNLPAPLWSRAMMDEFKSALDVQALKIAKANAPIKGRSANVIILDDLVTDRHSYLTVDRGKESGSLTALCENGKAPRWRLFSLGVYSHPVVSLSVTAHSRSMTGKSAYQVGKWQVQLYPELSS